MPPSRDGGFAVLSELRRYQIPTAVGALRTPNPVSPESQSSSRRPRSCSRAACWREVAGVRAARRRRHHRLAARVVVPRDRGVGVAAVAVQDVQQVAVEAVDVGAGLRLAGVVGERGLIGDVDRDRMLEVDGALARAVHRADARGGVVFLRLRNAQQHLGVFIRVLHPHAAVAVGPRVMREQLLVRRVVLIDQEAVREIEADAAERIALARRLEDADRAVLVAADLQADPRQRARDRAPAPADIRCG